jgi:hypothetical protein
MYEVYRQKTSNLNQMMLMSIQQGNNPKALEAGLPNWRMPPRGGNN